jgi:MFS family permease
MRLTPVPILGFLRHRPALGSLVAIHSADELATQMLNVAVGWYVYSATRNPMSLAYLGLAQFLPKAGVLLLAGHAADRLDRRRVISASLAVQAACLAAFTAWFMVAAASSRAVYPLVLILGLARAFASPALSALLPQTVGKAEFPRAVAANSSAFQVCSIAGPAIGGFLYAISGTALFATAAALYFLAILETRSLSRTIGDPSQGEREVVDAGILAGLGYIRANRLLLALISLDLFAVLLGGVSALLPIYARDILSVGPFGLGCLRCAPGVGAAIVGYFLAQRPIEGSTGKLMLSCVAGFGMATAFFALSKNLWLSLAALAVGGGFDMVSMVIRQTLIQLSTPDAMRGRVSAVNWVFIGASSELGEFESGLTAALFGTVPAALLGGLGTLAVVGLWSVLFPELRGTNDDMPGSADSASAAD